MVKCGNCGHEFLEEIEGYYWTNGMDSIPLCNSCAKKLGMSRQI